MPTSPFFLLAKLQQGLKTFPKKQPISPQACLAAGYRSMVATMWSILDADAPIVAEEVYRRLFRAGSKPDSTQAAYALHHAVKLLRERKGGKKEEGGRWFSWVPFIHVGL